MTTQQGFLPEALSATPNALTILVSVVFVFVVIAGAALLRRHKYFKQCEKVPGPPAQIPLFGSITEVYLDPAELINYIKDLHAKYSQSGPLGRIWIGPFPIFVLFQAESAEVIFSSSKLIDKSREYSYLWPWLNTGLLTSTGEKWFQRRKMLTPTFHFKILEDFLHVFNEQSAVMAGKLEKVGTKAFDVFPCVTHCALDIICESAMGRHVNAQGDGDSDYVKAIYKMSHIIQARQFRPWLQPDWMFNLHSYGPEQKRHLAVLQGFTDQVIRERKNEYKKSKAEKERQNASEKKDDDDLLTKKPRLAFLDLLIEASDDGKVLSDLDIREEVDTFMFEGHDTTAAAITFTLHLLGRNPEAQKLANEEVVRIFGDSDRPVTMADLNEMKYLECCIKEAMRIFPSVPFMGRELNSDINIAGFDLPAGSTVLIPPFLLHRDLRYFPDPECYKPERFFPENARGRHPFAYTPFSAGPRNCIGQKFAMMEMKVVVSSVLRQFHFEALQKTEDIVLLAEVILRPRDGIPLRVTPKPRGTLSVQ